MSEERAAVVITVDGGVMAAGPRLRAITDAGLRGLVGVNRGTTGQEAVVRRRLDPSPKNDKAL